MCAFNDPAALRKLRRRTKPIRAWKVLTKSGGNTTAMRKVKYGPGQTMSKGVTRTTRYNYINPRGLHVCRTKRCARWWRYAGEHIVPVYIDPKDLIAAECAGITTLNGPQLVTRKLTIQPEDWEAAGLPKRATRRRYI